MMGVFSINAYVGIKDTALSKLQPAHETANFFLALFDVVSASILLAYGQGKTRWVFLSGVVWPAVYLLSIVADVESRLCLFSGTNCYASVGDAYRYLILGEIGEGWKLWKYTIPSAILLLVLVMVMSAVYCQRSAPAKGAAADEDISRDKKVFDNKSKR
jgi:hypothetical protein